MTPEAAAATDIIASATVSVSDAATTSTKTVRDPRGAIWRRWDLHVHTPASIVAVNYGGNDEAAWQRYFDALRKLPPDIRVLGINDYIFVDGYKRVHDEWQLGNLSNIDLVLPVVELRVDRFGGTESALKRVNYHVIFSDQVPLHAIEQQFLARLEATYRLRPDTTAISWQGSPTRESLQDLGREIIASVDESRRHEYGTPLVEGFNNFNVTLASIEKALGSPYFQGSHLTAVGKTEWSAVKWLDGSIAEKKTVINGVNFVFIAADSAEAANKAKRDLGASGVNARLLDCSDAHSYADSTDKDRLGNCCTWVRADPTFEGLKHVLSEFTDRVYLGDEPPLLRRIRMSPTKTITRVTLRRRSGSALADPWFDGVSLPVNPGMVAIIGNKGSGKSALVDILGLVGNSRRQAYASFLSRERFRRPSSNKSAEFEASVAWADGADDGWRVLNDDVPASAVERVSYIPQSLFETICNELAATGRGQFDKELKRVIFSHVRDEQRLGHATLDEWVEHRTSELFATAEERRARLNEINRRIVTAETKLRSQYRDELEARLAIRQAELNALDHRRPAVVAAPSEAPSAAMNAVVAQYALLVQQRDQCLAELANARRSQALAHERLVSIDLVETRLQRLAREVESARTTVEPQLATLGVSYDALVQFALTLEPLAEIRTREQAVFATAQSAAGEMSTSGLAEQLRTLNAAIADFQAQLDAPNRLYQEYQHVAAAWESERAVLVGSLSDAESLEYLKAQIVALSLLPDELTSLNEARRGLASEILECLASATDFLRTLYAPVQEFIDRSDEARRTMKLSFYAAVQDVGFTERFLERIHQGRVGTFAGREDGEKRVRSLLSRYDLSTQGGALDFAEEVVRQLKADVRDSERPQPMIVADQIRSSQTVEELYDYIFGFEYLKPQYGLRFGGRELLELSPGEKGALLLVFYLLVDRSDVPLLIDQPEENLDNETIYSLLVPSIRVSKQRRQVIIVTHNPNLAVVCDADQVIVAARDVNGPTRISYASGAIESPDINRRIVDILEGTRPAFDNRSGKYH